MEKLTTQRLLAYKRKHLTPGQSPACSSYCDLYEVDPGECQAKCPKTYQERISFDRALKTCKDILMTREHIPRKPRGSK